MGHRYQGSDSPSASLPLQTRHHHSTCFFSCFGTGGGVADDTPSQASPSPRSPSAWFRSKASELPEVQGKCRSFISHIGRRRHHSADFRYDPLSYALNFDDGGGDDDSPVSSADELRYVRFSARLPAPPRSSARFTPN